VLGHPLEQNKTLGQVVLQKEEIAEEGTLQGSPTNLFLPPLLLVIMTCRCLKQPTTPKLTSAFTAKGIERERERENGRRNDSAGDNHFNIIPREEAAAAAWGGGERGGGSAGDDARVR